MFIQAAFKLAFAFAVLHNVAGNDWEDLLTTQANPSTAFRAWVTDHAKDYINNVEEYGKRLDIFKSNVEFIAQHNSQHPDNHIGLNLFADLTFDEFKSTKLGLKPELTAEQPNLLETFRYSQDVAPLERDWVKDGAVTEVKNQGQCGSCWAFSTTGSLEGINYLKTGTLKTLSEQELVDCDKEQDQGCSGGLMVNAFEFIIKNGGIDSENDYRYWGSYPSFCNSRKEHDRTVVDLTGYENVPPNDETALTQAVANQPVSVAICVDAPFQFYRGGIVERECCTQLNHGVLAVGYGVEDGKSFWKVKNSWGAAWGEEGYFRLKKDIGAEGTCGIAMMPTYPVKDDTTNPPVPTICDAQLFSLFECPASNACQCSFSFFGLFCLTYDCVPTATVECGGSDRHCNIATPVCDVADGVCFSSNGAYHTPMLNTTPATRRVKNMFRPWA